MSHRPTPEPLSSINRNIWPYQSSQWRVGREPAGAFRDALVEFTAYCDHVHEDILPANVLLRPASPAGTECTSKLWEEFTVFLYGTWEDVVPRRRRRCRRRQRPEQSKEVQPNRRATARGTMMIAARDVERG